MYSSTVIVRSCICPVCGLSIDQDMITQHVEQHFCNSTASSEQAQIQHQHQKQQHYHPKHIEGQIQVKVGDSSTTMPLSHPQKANQQPQQHQPQQQNKVIDKMTHNASYSGNDNEIKTCNFNGCQDIVFVSEWDDHIFAHMLENQDDVELMMLASGEDHPATVSSPSSSLSVPSDCVNDNMLAQLTQQDIDSTDLTLHDEWLITSELNKEPLMSSEDNELQQLQNCLYGLPNEGSFHLHVDKSLPKDTSSFKVPSTDYFSRKADVMQTLMTGHDSGESQTKGIVAKLKEGYQNGVTGIRSVFLCIETDHFASSVGDAGWGCGYRNAQMLISALIRSSKYRKCLIDGLGGSDMLSIPKIQSLIEQAWQNGFDSQGAEQLGRKLHNTSKWIGATEIAVLLRSFGIRARLVDFHQASGSDGTHPSMFTWIHQYYRKRQNEDEDLPPLFLQHQGHSRLCIGVEEHPRGECPIYLLLFDPSHAPRQMQALLQNLSTNMSAQLRLLRRSLKQMRSKQYQIVFIDGLMASEEEYIRGKTFESIRVP